MDVERAIDQIDAIQDHLHRTQVYRGFHSYPVALSGLSALAASALQGAIAGYQPNQHFVLYWSTVAGLNAIALLGVLGYRYWREETLTEQRSTRIVIGQIAPALAAGMILAIVFYHLKAEAIAMLPGLWTLTFSLGLFAARPSLPRHVGWVALFYFMAGGAMMAWTGAGYPLSHWCLGVTFATGQFASALILFWNLERGNHGRF